MHVPGAHIPERHFEYTTSGKAKELKDSSKGHTEAHLRRKEVCNNKECLTLVKLKV